MRSIALLMTLMLTGCATSRVVLSSKWNEDTKPSYVDFVDAWALGFIGKQRIDGRAVCLDQRPYAVQQGTTVIDGLITLFTLGIYAPTTVRIWCGN